MAGFAYNSTRHASTQVPPCEVVHGYSPSPPVARVLNLDSTYNLKPYYLDVRSFFFEQCKESLHRAQAYRKNYADS